MNTRKLYEQFVRLVEILNLPYWTMSQTVRNVVSERSNQQYRKISPSAKPTVVPVLDAKSRPCAI